MNLNGSKEGGAVLEAVDLRKYFGAKKAVDGVSLKIRKGEIFSLLGPNGAGKTTIIKMLYGFLDPDSGSIHYSGKDFTGHRRGIKLSIGVCSQNDTLDYDLTVRTNLEIFGTYYHMRAHEARKRAGILLDRFRLEEYAEKKPRQLSGGLKRRLQIARALINDPHILFLDEPTVGLDPHVRRELWSHLHELRKEGVTVFLTTHYMEEAETLADHVVILDEGEIIEEGDPAGMIRRHFGRWILQVRETGDMVARLKSKGIPYFGGYGWLTIHAEDEAVNPVSLDLGGEAVVRREPNLEDLFIKLTGRGL